MDAPLERIKARAADGPTREPATELPPRRQRVMAGVVAFAVFIGAAAFAWQGFRSGSEALGGGPQPKPPPPPAVLDFDGSADPGTMTLTFEGESLGATSVAWDVCDETGENCESAIADYDVGEFLPIPVGTSIVTEGDAFDISGRFSLWGVPCDQDCKVRMRTSVPSVPGEYELLVDASFPRGKVTFSVGVGVYEPQPTASVASMSFVAKSNPEGAIKFGDATQVAVRGEYTWCDGSDAACVHGIPDFVSDPPVEEFIEIPPGTPLALAETVRDIKGGFHTLDGEKASPTIEDQEHLGTIPTEPGMYAFQLHIALEGEDGGHGSATFWFGVRARPVATESTDPTTDELSNELRVVCSAAGTKVLTPVVVAQPDGVHVVVEAEASAVHVGFRELDRSLDSPIVSSGGQIPTFEPSPWPIAPGRADVRCRGEEYGGTSTIPPAPFEVVDPNGYWLDGTMACAVGDPAVTVVGYDGGAAEYVSDEAAIRSLLVCIGEQDRVGLPFYRGGKDSRFIIVRDGSVVGTVWLGITDSDDPRGGGLTKVVGEVCGSSGIQGNVPPHDPDEDGVSLDCRPSAQVAFPAPEGPVAVVLPGPAGPEATIDVIVEGVIDADDVTLEQPGGGDGEGTYVITRDGVRLGSVLFPDLSGIACRWSGIGGV